MKYEQLKRECMFLNPMIFPNENELLRHLFFVIGNGFRWIDGELVDICDRRPLGVRVAESEKSGRLYHSGSKRKSKTIYPLCEYARIANLPDNIKTDWLLAAKKALRFSRSLKKTKSDRRYLREASRRVRCLTRIRR